MATRQQDKRERVRLQRRGARAGGARRRAAQLLAGGRRARHGLGLRRRIRLVRLALLPPARAGIPRRGRRTAPGDGRRLDRRILGRSLAFVGTFSAIFVFLGLTATALGAILFDSRNTLNTIAGVLIVAMGLLFIARSPSSA